MDITKIKEKIENIIPKMQIAEEAAKAILLLRKIDKGEKQVVYRRTKAADPK